MYIELDGLRLLVDPVFSNYASPINGIGRRRYHPPPIAMTDLPRIDAVMILHDHYDHLGMRTIQYLSSKGALLPNSRQETEAHPLGVFVVTFEPIAKHSIFEGCAHDQAQGADRCWHEGPPGS